MPGIRLAYTLNGRPPVMVEELIGKSETIYAGDALALTTNATYAINSVPCVRKVLAADKTAHYKEGTPVAGILGVAEWGGTTNSSGQWTSAALPGGVQPGAVNYQFPSMGGGISQEPVTAQSRVVLYGAVGSNVFVCALDSTASVATPALNNTLAGLILTTSNGITTFTIDTGAASADQCLRIIRCDESDPLYNNGHGGRVFFQFLGSFDQYETGVNYSSN